MDTSLRFTQPTTQVKLGTSEPIGSVGFCARIPIQISSDEFRSVPMGSIDFQQIPGRNLPELFQRKLDRNLVGTQRSRQKTNAIYRIRCRKTIGSDGRNSGPGKKQKPDEFDHESQDHNDHLLKLCSSCRFSTTINDVSGYVLLFGRNLRMMCCFFMTTHLFASPTLHN